MNKDWIALDWGTSSLRAWLLDENNHVIDTRRSKQGVKFINRKDFPKVFSKITKGWLNQVDNIYACGMVGSSIGWKETPYLRVEKLRVEKNSNPKKVKNDFISKSLTKIGFKGKSIFIVPGYSYLSQDVMRGEETILHGFSEWLKKQKNPTSTLNSYLAVLPGTHSKWVKFDKQIKGFNTFLTGELFEIISSHSILKQSLNQNTSSLKSFKIGLKNGSQDGILGNLFCIRANKLLKPKFSLSGADELSGLLISEEIKSGLKKYQPKKNQPIFLLGDPESKFILNYKEAFKFYGTKIKIIDVEPLTLLGLSFIKNQHLK